MCKHIAYMYIASYYLFERVFNEVRCEKALYIALPFFRRILHTHTHTAAAAAHIHRMFRLLLFLPYHACYIHIYNNTLPMFVCVCVFCVCAARKTKIVILFNFPIIFYRSRFNINILSSRQMFK